MLYLQKLGPDCDRSLQRLILIEIEIISEEDLIQQSGGEKVQIITFAALPAEATTLWWISRAASPGARWTRWRGSPDASRWAQEVCAL